MIIEIIGEPVDNVDEIVKDLLDKYGRADEISIWTREKEGKLVTSTFFTRYTRNGMGVMR